MVQEGRLRRKHFHVLLQSSVTTLDLSAASAAANHDTILTILMNRCPKLISVNLSGLNCLSARALSEFVKTLPALKVANLEKTKCNDQVLACFGNSCTSIVDLNLESTPITNSGVLSLCGGLTTDRPGCTKLVKLNILHTMVDEIGASYILEHIGSLRYLGFQDICGAIQHGGTTERNVSPDLTGTYRLRNVTSFTMSCEDTFIKCPFATEVSLLHGLRDSTVPLLNSLSNIQILRLGNFHENILTFENGLLPYLREKGQNLTELELSEIGPVDILDIARMCPNLQHFSYSHLGPENVVHSSTVYHSQRMTLFSNLTHFKVVLSCIEENFPREALECIFNNAKNIQKVHVINVRNSNENLFNSFLSHNPMHCLQELRLEHCNWITGEAIMTLLEQDNDLQAVYTLNCDHVSVRDHEEFKKYVKVHDLCMSLIWT